MAKSREVRRDDSGKFAASEDTEPQPVALEDQYPDAFPQQGPGYHPSDYPPQYAPAPYGYAYPPARSGGGFSTIFMMLIIVGLAVGLTYVIVSDGSSPAPAPSPDGGNVSELSREIGRVLSGAERADDAADYLEVVCRAAGNRVKADINEDVPELDTREEASDLVGQVGYFARVGNFTGHIDGLDRVVEEAFKGSFPTNDEGEEIGGKLEPKDRDEIVRRWSKLADAFGEH